MNQNEQTIANMFNGIARRYDLLNRILSARQDQRWRRALVDAVPFRKDGFYLDVATGTGDVLLAVRDARREYARFVGVDIADGMLALAKQKSATRGFASTVEWMRQSALSLQFADQSVDTISISFGLRNVADKEQALQEFWRVLKPGGALLILEFFQPENTFFAASFRFYFKNILPFIGGLLSDPKAYAYLPESVVNFYGSRTLCQKLGEVGFQVVGRQSFLFGHVEFIAARRPDGC